MLNTIEEAKQFIAKKPNKAQVKIEMQDLQKRFKDLDKLRHDYGKSNSILSNTVHDELGVWTHHERWPERYKKEFIQNNKKINEINDKLTIIQEIQILLDEYKPIEYVQTKLDFNSLTEQLKKYL